jgi:hypothetical protein
VGGVSLFRGDVGYGRPFKDSGLTSPTTNQVGHMLCALESGVRAGRYAHRPIRRWVYERTLRIASRVMGLSKDVQPTIADWSRAGIIGHEMIGDEDGSGFLGQMNAYGRLVAGGDPDHVREAWDRGVAAVLAHDHVAAWTAIRQLARAAEVPETPAEVAANLANPHPRFAKAGVARPGNSLADLGLSMYGFALGQRSQADGYPTPAAARADLTAFLTAGGVEAGAIERAWDATR